MIRRFMQLCIIMGRTDNHQELFCDQLYGDLDTTKAPISVAGGITLGMGEEEF